MSSKATKLPRRVLLVVAALGIGLGASAIALATIPDANGVIHACYKKSGGTLRVIDDSVTTCASGETALSWSTAPQQAPQTILWAIVNSDGSLDHGNGVVSSERVFQGRYLVHFNQVVEGCAAFATPINGLVSILAFTPSNPGTDEVLVDIGYDPQNSVDAPFQVEVVC